MTTLYIVSNQHGHFWGKAKEWVDGSDARAVYRSKHEDEAINTLFELSAKDPDLRGKVASAQASDKGQPQVTVSDVPLPSQGEDDDVASADELTATPAA